ncbi:MAG: c-type cytochrome [Alphaproteobacteria bacterium]|nr:c-type cytochrome [Alphaproteobacteria bacterium]
MTNAGYVFTLFVASLVAAAFMTDSAAAQSKRKGKNLFEDKCTVCHTAEEGARIKFGPNLFGVFGAEAGLRPGAEDAASDALKESGVTWDEDTLDEWLSDLPAVMIPGVRMGFGGIPDDKDRADVIAYLKSLN